MSLSAMINRLIHHSPPPQRHVMHSPPRVNNEADEAIQAAQARLAEARAQRPEVERVANSLRQLRTHNHFGDAIEASMLKRKS